MSKKELIEAYKNRKRQIGVFQIRNTANGKILIGSSVNLDKIWNRHLTELNFGSHRSTELQADWKQYGPQHFVYEILAELDEEPESEVELNRDLKALEELYLDSLQPYEGKGYNKKPR